MEGVEMMFHSSPRLNSHCSRADALLDNLSIHVFRLSYILYRCCCIGETAARVCTVTQWTNPAHSGYVLLLCFSTSRHLRPPWLHGKDVNAALMSHWISVNTKRRLRAAVGVSIPAAITRKACRVLFLALSAVNTRDKHHLIISY